MTYTLLDLETGEKEGRFINLINAIKTKKKLEKDTDRRFKIIKLEW